MSEPSRSITHGNLLPTERSARPMATARLPRFGWPSQWQQKRVYCSHCRVLLYPTSTPTPTELIVAVDCWSCGRTLCELVPDGYRLVPVAALADEPKARRGPDLAPRKRPDSVAPATCCDCHCRPATRRWRLCDECMGARQQAAAQRRQHELRSRERERMTQADRDARNARRRARRRLLVGVVTR